MMRKLPNSIYLGHAPYVCSTVVQDECYAATNMFKQVISLIEKYSLTFRNDKSKKYVLMFEQCTVHHENVKDLWEATEDWVRLIYDSHFRISDIEKIVGDKGNTQLKQSIILSVRYVIYCKRKTGKKMTLGDLRRCLQKDLNITRLHETMTKDGDIFDQKWNTFLIDLREDNDTKNIYLGAYYDEI